MTREEIIQGLQFTIDMFLFDPTTGETFKEPRNDMDKTTIDSCREAIEALEQQPCYNPDEWCKTCSEYNQDKHCCPRYNNVIRNAVEEIKQQSCEDAISRADAINKVTNFYTNCERLKMFRHTSNEVKQTVTDILCDLPLVQPKITNKSEKSTGSNDCIDRAQAQTELEMNACRYTIAKEHDCMGQVEWSDQLIKVSDAVDIIRHLSSVMPQEPKTGQWVLLDECSNSGYYCSECHKKLVKEGWSGTVKKIKFCPNCGCRMVEPQESEE